MQLEGGRSRIGFGTALARGVRLGVRFRGRATRREFWFFFLAYAVVFLTVGLVETAVDDDWAYTAGTVLYLAGLVPFVSVGVRRLHDLGRRGGWCFLMISCIGWLVLLAFWSERGQPGGNRFGPPPR
jgi:uncharacterized membrane protein YhaH (DUF805 family)